MKFIPRPTFTWKCQLFRFVIMILYTYTLNFPILQIQAQWLLTSQIRSCIEYLILAYSILVLFLRSTLTRKPNDIDEFLFDFVDKLLAAFCFGPSCTSVVCAIWTLDILSGPPECKRPRPRGGAEAMQVSADFLLSAWRQWRCECARRNGGFILLITEFADCVQEAIAVHCHLVRSVRSPQCNKNVQSGPEKLSHCRVIKNNSRKNPPTKLWINLSVTEVQEVVG